MGIIRRTLSNAVKAAQIATGITLGLGSFWLVYSKLAVDHNAPTLGLPHWEQTSATTAALDAFWAEIEA